MPWISRAGSLTQSEMENNANIVIQYFLSQNYNYKTIAGILGNLQAESTINPERQEVGGSGFGLVQWTPPTTLQNACNTLGISPYTDGDNQLQVIDAQLLGNPASLNTWGTASNQVSPYYNSGATSDMIGISASDFKSNTMNWSSDKLAVMFMVGFERPSYDPNINHSAYRQQCALQWEQYITQGNYFTPRLDANGIQGNFHWYSENPFYQAGYGMPNCTCYSWRALVGMLGPQ